MSQGNVNLQTTQNTAPLTTNAFKKSKKNICTWGP